MKQKLKAYYIDLVKDRRKGARDALFCFLLLLASFVYGFFLRLILSCYQIGLLKSYEIGRRVVSVGNITWGGTGKTPLVEAMARFFKQQGGRPAVLIRGYGSDEVDMLKSKLKDTPVLAGRDRIKTAQEAQKRYGADTIILDDGFQHWRLRRDLDIVLIDATCPFGNSRLIPRGILREPLSSLGRADAFIVTRANEASQSIEPIKKELRRYNRQAAIYEAIHSPVSLGNLTDSQVFDLSIIRDERIAVLSGIGNPQSFTMTLKRLGARVSLEFHFPDHYQYSKGDLEKIESQCLKEQIKAIITTQKDGPRLIPLLKTQKITVKILALRIEAKIVKKQEQFFNLLNQGKENQSAYSILILSDGKAGHINQSKAIAGIIRKRKIEQGRRFDEVNTKIVEVKFKNRFCRILLGLCSIFASPHCRKCLRCVRFCLEKGSFKELIGVAANIVVSAGSSLSSLNLFLSCGIGKYKNIRYHCENRQNVIAKRFSCKNKARSICLMKPSFLSLDRFDLVIVPEHDRVEKRENVLLTKIAPNLIDKEYLEEQAKVLTTNYELRTPNLKGPTIGVLIGGDTTRYRLTAGLMDKIIAQLKESAQSLDGQVLVTTSRRSSETVEELLKENLRDFNRCKLLVIANEKNIPEAVGGILGLSDIIVVSGESVSMVSEAISAEKCVLVFEPEKRVRATTKQERFLENLRKEGILKLIQPDNLSSEIKVIWKDKPKKVKIKDKEAIYQAITRII